MVFGGTSRLPGRGGHPPAYMAGACQRVIEPETIRGCPFEDHPSSVNSYRILSLFQSMMASFKDMNRAEQQERIRRRDDDVRRLRRLTVVAGVLGIGVFGTASLVAASSQPGRAIAATGTAGSPAVQSSSFTSQPSFQPPAEVPFRGRSRAMAVSGGS